MICLELCHHQTFMLVIIWISSGISSTTFVIARAWDASICTHFSAMQQCKTNGDVPKHLRES
jgi:hypothetical protein